MHFSSGIYTATSRIIFVRENYPLRPDGGKWIAVGSHYPQDFDFDSYKFGKYCYGGERRAYWENFLGAKSIDLPVYDTQPNLNKYEHAPVEIHDENLCKLLYIIHKDMTFDMTGFDTMFLEDIPHLVACGILKIENGKPKVWLSTAPPIYINQFSFEIFKITDGLDIEKYNDILKGKGYCLLKKEEMWRLKNGNNINRCRRRSVCISL